MPSLFLNPRRSSPLEIFAAGLFVLGGLFGALRAGGSGPEKETQEREMIEKLVTALGDDKLEVRRNTVVLCQVIPQTP